MKIFPKKCHTPGVASPVAGCRACYIVSVQSILTAATVCYYTYVRNTEQRTVFPFTQTPCRFKMSMLIWIRSHHRYAYAYSQKLCLFVSLKYEPGPGFRRWWSTNFLCWGTLPIPQFPLEGKGGYRKRFQRRSWNLTLLDCQLVSYQNIYMYIR